MHQPLLFDSYDIKNTLNLYQNMKSMKTITKNNFSIISLFSGAGGLDLGFKKAGFNTIWANEFDQSIVPSFKNYFKNVYLDTRSISNVLNDEIPIAAGVIGGPPCQSWSEAGARRGIEDPRGKLFFEYIRVIKTLRPLFFVAENVSGLIHKKNVSAFKNILELFKNEGYNVSWKLVNASDFGVPQDRERVFIVGYSDKIGRSFEFPIPLLEKVTLKSAIGDLAKIKLNLNGHSPVKNHEISDTGFSPIFMSRNRVRSWNEQSFTILACDRHIPLHPMAPKMISNGKKDEKIFVPGSEKLYRRLSVRECARIQTFPDDYHFLYSHVRTGYKMIGNAVPVNLGYHVAIKIKQDLDIYYGKSKK
jgi:DNA (cytosine-5)-methyltransferase 1